MLASSNQGALRETGRAKVNLTLRVVGRRGDGYHDLESVVAFADCADQLSLVPGSELTLTTIGPLAGACGETSDNLVLKAARLLSEAVPGLELGAFTLEKVLPVAAGIGGGSADAAAALRLLARRNGLALDDPRLVAVALQTGADVPVCVASRACTMTGVGENLLPLDLPVLPCVMINPRVPVATKDVFQALGLKPGELLVGVTDVLTAPAWPGAGASVSDWVDALGEVRNDLEPPALKVQPIIGTVLDSLRASGGVLLARMSGSGATCFAIYGSDADAKSAGAQIAAAHPEWWVHAGTLS
ncbi:4-(cytidine 5'-diphospho)-2-C-methyl-D-erythritol kinase [Bradyrhizobium ontarionense]|uniref:4-diphosphocytidyl-2-C-methyl-D-erythritol kinase n=1 Tax=Bradyrhizobium ontarionense TaxID=2898149 RepID=A0ABY3RKR2_9BRAD|nr:4-(cytidine 5'-diphospho)-2-C-methyl-D-erythritol kinase [Bradyrhizobium sp. A19]UFZ07353.1 4-(cytidine 5'-diphospho)-2-C-methyl-D-erythritol kinase [Bradyrhizobium sp. A19]